MSKTDCATQEGIANTDARIAGPFTGYDQYGRPDHVYYRCTACGAESTQKRHLYGCC